MIKHISVGVDIGSKTTRVVVAEHKEGVTYPTVLSLVSTETRGVRHGYIVHPEETKKVIRKAIREASDTSGIDIKKVLISIGGVSLNSVHSTGTTMIGRADGEVTELDIDKATKDAHALLNLVNRKIIFQNIISYKIDGVEVLGNPIGMKGAKIELKILFIFCLEQHIDFLEEIFVENNIEVVDIVPSPIAGAQAVLTERQKTVGVGLVNIGAETVSIIVYENNAVIGLHVFGIGSNDITNDIALGLKIELDEAESIKTGNKDALHKRKLDDIIEARLSDIFELVGGYLKKIKRYELLPAGIVLTGGGSTLGIMEEFSKTLLKLPTRKATLEVNTEIKGKVRDASWNVAYGLVLLAKEYEEFVPIGNTKEIFKKVKKTLSQILRQFLP